MTDRFKLAGTAGCAVPASLFVPPGPASLLNATNLDRDACARSRPQAGFFSPVRTN